MIKATFIGKNEMGFIHGKTYEIRTECHNIRKHVGGSIFGHTESMCCICVYDLHSSAWCPYSSLETMLDNWFILQTKNKSNIKTATVNVDKLNVRKRPGNSFNPISGFEPVLYLERGTNVVLEDDPLNCDEWGRITTEDGKINGYVCLRYLKYT